VRRALLKRPCYVFVFFCVFVIVFIASSFFAVLARGLVQQERLFSLDFLISLLAFPSHHAAFVWSCGCLYKVRDTGIKKSVGLNLRGYLP